MADLLLPQYTKEQRYVLRMLKRDVRLGAEDHLCVHLRYPFCRASEV